MREATAKGKKKKSQRDQLREAGDLMRQFNEYLFLSCACGLRFKVPPDFKHDAVSCPKCKRNNPLPTAQMATAAAVAGAAIEQQQQRSKPGVRAATQRKGGRKREEPISIRRSSKQEWQSFKCVCGKTKSLSPSFNGSKCRCNHCGQQFELN